MEKNNDKPRMHAEREQHSIHFYQTEKTQECMQKESNIAYISTKRTIYIIITYRKQTISIMYIYNIIYIAGYTCNH